MNRIKEAIGLYNQHREKNEPKMTQKRLVQLVMHDFAISDKTKEQLMLWWIQEERKIDFVILRRICRQLNTSSDFIIGL